MEEKKNERLLLEGKVGVYSVRRCTKQRGFLKVQ